MARRPDPRTIPTFGVRTPGARYVLRPGGYAVVRDAQGRVAVVTTRTGRYLPGGGQEPGETPRQAATREVLEEAGLTMRITRALGVADQLAFAAAERTWYRKRCTFFLATVVRATTPGEAGHTLHWLPLQEALAVVTHDSERWALRRARTPLELADAARAGLTALPRLTTPHVRGLRRQWSRELAERPARDVERCVDRLLAGAGWAERLLAYELVRGHAGAFARLGQRRVRKLARGLQDWGSIDLFGVTIAGPAWRAELISDACLARWTRSRDRWQRRLALVATVALNGRTRAARAPTERTLAVASALVDDRDPMVVKALSWALRALGKRDRPAVRAWLAERGSRAAALVRYQVGRAVIARSGGRLSSGSAD